eukprot:289210-Prymnesium_polylepis.3
MSKKQLGGVKELRFRGLATPSVDDMQGLARCLNLCASLQVFTISKVGMSDAACAALFSTFARGAMAKLWKLLLSNNKIGEEGMKSFSTALASGAMAQLKELHLCKNRIDDEGMKAFSTALASGAMAQ